MEKILQSAVLPYRFSEDKIQLLLIRTRSGNQWTIPKGIIDPGYTPQETAAEEAFEEAGISGTIYESPYGRFTYEKWASLCEVKTFIMRVEHIHDHWPEKIWRPRRWISRVSDLNLIKYPSMKRLIQDFLNDERLHVKLK